MAPVRVAATVPDYMPNRASIPVEVERFEGKVLRTLRVQDRSAGLQARTWIRFLHTGAAFGVPGKIVATLATLGSLVLVYTGFALSYRRFFGRLRKQRNPAPTDKPATQRAPAPRIESSQVQFGVRRFIATFLFGVRRFIAAFQILAGDNALEKRK